MAAVRHVRAVRRPSTTTPPTAASTPSRSAARPAARGWPCSTGRDGRQDPLQAAAELLPRTAGSSPSRASAATTWPPTRPASRPSPRCGRASTARTSRSRSWSPTWPRPRHWPRSTPAAAALLTSPARPIVLLPRRPGRGRRRPSAAPGNRQLGVMLPYTPLHHLLLAAVAGPIVLTSGNVSDEPIAYRDDEARETAGGHRRRVPDPRPGRSTSGPTTRWCGRSAAARCCSAAPAATSPSRSAVATGVPAARAGLRRRAEEHLLPGQGAPRLRLAPHRRPGERRDAALVHRGHRALPPAVRRSTRRSSRTTCTRSTCPPSTRSSWTTSSWWACSTTTRTSPPAWPTTASTGPVIGVAFDGTGYGTDGTIWGGEFLVADLAGFERGRPPGAGADARRRGRHPGAVADGRRLPRRRLAAGPRHLAVVGRNPDRWAAGGRDGRPGINSPLTSSAGPAVRRRGGPPRRPGRDQLRGPGRGRARAAGRPGRGRRLPGAGSRPGDGALPRSGGSDLLRAVVEDRTAGVPAPVIAARFHNGVAALIEAGCLADARRHGLATVALSGGVFQNLLLLRATVGRLEARGFRVLLHSRVPPNDGGISLGQAVVAAQQSPLLADPGRGSPTSRSTIRVPPNDVFSSTSPGGSSRTWPMTAALLAERVGAQRGHRARRRRRPARPRPAGPRRRRTAGRCRAARRRRGPRGGPGSRPRSTSTATSAALAISLQDRGHPAAGRVAQAADPGHRVQQAADQAVQRGRVRADVGLDVQLAAGQHDRDAVVADRPGHDDRVARLGRGHAQSAVRRSITPTPAVLM